MNAETEDALRQWANIITAEVQNLCEAQGNPAAVRQLMDAMREINSAMDQDDQAQPCPELSEEFSEVLSQNFQLVQACQSALNLIQMHHAACESEPGIAAIGELERAIARAQGTKAQGH